MRRYSFSRSLSSTITVFFVAFLLLEMFISISLPSSVRFGDLFGGSMIFCVKKTKNIDVVHITMVLLEIGPRVAFRRVAR